MGCIQVSTAFVSKLISCKLCCNKTELQKKKLLYWAVEAVSVMSGFKNVLGTTI